MFVQMQHRPLTGLCVPSAVCGHMSDAPTAALYCPFLKTTYANIVSNFMYLAIIMCTNYY